MIYFVLHDHSMWWLDNFLGRLGADIAHLVRGIPIGSLTESQQLEPGLYIVGGINRFGPGAKDIIARLYDAVHGQHGFTIYNHPTRSLDRFELLSELHRRGLNEFKVFGAWEDLRSVRYPAFVKDRHVDGGIPELVHTPWQLDRVLGRHLLNGKQIHKLLVTEFLDTADENGTFEKLAAFRFGDHIHPASIDAGSQWVLRRHSGEYTPESIAREVKYLRENPHRAELYEIFDIAGIEFGRIDYGMKNGKIQTWEINTLPLLGMPPGVEPLPDHLAALRAPVNEGYQRTTQFLVDAIPEHDGAPPVRLEVPPSTLERVRAEIPSGEVLEGIPPTRFPLARALLRPTKKLLNPVADAVWLPIWARRARAAARWDSLT